VLAAMAIASTGSPTAARQTSSAALVDPEVTTGAGATIVTTVGEALARAGDIVVPHRLFLEDGSARRSGNITFRLLKVAFLDAPQERLLLVVNHELFGHGARLRERFDGPVGYRIGVPAPYGRGGGSTTFIFDRQPSLHERLAVHVAGMEASAVAADLLASRAISDGTMTGRDALRYLGFELDTLTYILSTAEEGEDPGHDVGDFLAAYNEGAHATDASPLRARMLRRQALVGFANPMLAYAAWGLGRYIATGTNDVRVPAVTIAGVRYVPLVRYRLTSFGTEWSLVNELGGRLRPTQVELRVGRALDARPWGIAVRQREVKAWGRWTAGLALDVWRQPRFADSWDQPVPSGMRFGAHVRGRLERPLIPVWFSASGATLIVDVGLKSAGFAAGEPLGAGVVTRAGVGLPLTTR
jgi:hypothetical protein